MKNRLLFLPCFFVFVFSFLLKVKGQDFEVSPVAVKFELEPGEVGSKILNVTNYSSKPYDFQLELFDEEYQGEDVKKNLIPGTTKNSLSNWLSVSPNFFSLNPNETQKIDVSLSLPSDAFDTKWSVIYVKVATERTPFEADKQLATGLIVTPRIKVTVIQSPKSNTNYKGKILSFSEGAANEEAKRTFNVKLKNAGGKIISPKVYLLSANIKTAAERKSEPKGATLMPGQETTLTLEFPAGLPKGEYAVAAVMDCGHGSDLEVAQLMITIE